MNIGSKSFFLFYGKLAGVLGYMGEKQVMKRITVRYFSLLIGSLLVAVLVLAACSGDEQDKQKSYTVGIINPNPTAGETIDAFTAEMATRGHIEGQNIAYFTGVNGPELTGQVSTDKIDLLVVIGGTFGGTPNNPLTQAKTLAEGRIPIVVVPGSGDPIASGDAESLARPNKNITGLLLLRTDVKRFELLADILPDSAESVAVIYEPHNADATEQLPEIEAFAQQAGLDVLVYSTSSAEPETTDQALAEIPDDVDAIFLLKVWASSARWFQWAYDHRIPSSQDGRFDAPIQQPLMSYGPSSKVMGVRAANLADQILKGTRPGDLPMDYPDLILSIDIALAEAMGIDVPQASLNLADEIVRSDLSLYAAASPADTTQVTHVAGTGACAGQLKTMAGTFAVCVTAPCETLLDSGMVSYIDKTDVASCSTQNLVGTCSTSAFDLYYYSGDVGPLQIGCGFQTGHWIEPQS